MLRRLLLVLVALLLLAACDKLKTTPELKINVGQVFPQLALRDLDDKPVTFQPQANTVTVVNIWATWCGPCRREMPSLQHLADALAEKSKTGFQVIGISVDDDPLLMREYLIDKKILFANFRDVDMQATNQILGIRAFPSTYLIAADGRIVDIIEAWRYWDKPDMVARILALAQS